MPNKEPLSQDIRAYFIGLFFLLSTFLAAAENQLPFNESLQRLIQKTFFENNQPAPQKIELYRQTIYHRLQQVRQNLVRFYRLRKNLPEKKIQNKILTKKEIKAYQILLDYIKQLENLHDQVEFQRLALKILHMEYALRIEARKLPSVELLEKIPFSLKSKKIPRNKAPRGEASNLVNRATGTFYSQEELKSLKDQGLDISKLDPPADSFLWTRHAISRIHVPTYYQTGQDPLHRGLKIVFPQKKTYFHKVRRTQSKPKLDLVFYDQGEKYEVKLKVAAEVYSETTCAALYTTLGFSADITKYVKDFKVVLGTVTPFEFKKEWKSYYTGYDPNKYIKKEGEDEEGFYIVFYEGVLEAKPPDLLRVGPWAYGRNGNGGLREVRGTLLFNMWVANLDLKEAENNKLILRKINGEYRLFLIQHDMGFSFGKTYMERPGSFTWKLVKKITGNYIHMNFNCLVNNSLFKNVTYADARWMARLIASLTRQQISDAVTLGGWPLPLQRLLVEKLIARRNQLVIAFQLMGEKTAAGETIGIMAVDRFLDTRDGVVKKGKLKVYRFTEHPQYFGPRVNEIFALVLKGLRNGAVDSMVNLAASVRYVVLEPEWFGIDDHVISKIILRMDRRIEQNPSPSSEMESYLVKDTLSLGLRLGYGSIVSGDLAFWRNYTLVYPVASRDIGRFNNQFILNLLLPFNYRQNYPGRNFVVILEDYIEGRVKIQVPALHNMLKFALNGSRIGLRRQVMGFKNSLLQSQVIYFQDRSRYRELKFRVFLDIFSMFRSTPFRVHWQKGQLTRYAVSMDISNLKDNPAKKKALDQLILESDPTLIKKLGQQRFLGDRFFEKKSVLKMLGLIKNRSVFREDHLKEEIPDSDPTNFLQIESRKLRSWRFFDNGERHRSIIRLSGKTNSQGAVEDPVLTLLFQVDDRSTHNREFKDGYLNFINTISRNNKKDFITFDPDLHTVNRLWGYTRTAVEIKLNNDALSNMIDCGEDRVWAALSRVTGKSVDYWRSQAGYRDYQNRPYGCFYTPQRRLALKTRFFIRQLKKARKKKNLSQKMRHVVRAFRNAIFISGSTYEPTLLSALLPLLGNNNVFMKALVTMPESRELIFPAQAPLYLEWGIKPEQVYPVFHFIFDDPAEIYHIF